MRLGRRIGQRIGSTLGSVTGGFVGLLTKYSGASAGYSLRKIGSGPVVRLRRASDNAEKDFYAGEVAAVPSGSELITNGDFSNGSTGWTLGTAWSISGGQAVLDGTQTSNNVLFQLNIPGYAGVQGVFKLSFDITCSDYTKFQIQIPSGVPLATQLEIASDGSYEVILDTRNGTGTWGNVSFYTSVNGVTATIDNVSLVPYTPSAAEDWVIQNGGLVFDGSITTKQNTDSAFCTTWYDQSGSGNDATQSTSTAQPLLIRAGVTNTVNGKAALEFDGVDDYLEAGTGSLLGAAWATFSVFDSTASGSAEGLFESVSTGSINKRISFFSSSPAATSSLYNPENINNNTSTLLSPWTASQYLVSHELSADTVTPYSSGVIQTAVTNAAEIPGDTSALDRTRIGRQTIGGLYHSAGIQELILYPSDQSANRTGIETNINDHYGIY